MSKAGISDDVIIQTIQSTGSKFQLTAQDVESLKRDGVSEGVLAAMQANRPAAPYSAKPSEPAAPVVRESGGRDYVGGLSDQQVVRALPVAPQVYYYTPPPPAVYYYPAPVYYYNPPVRFFFGFGGGHHHHRHCW
ncbi:MAG: hypothetical protein HZC54_01275 [Verrucomicrobia bacterium]|nr:hypothetical protein [Verrucomicrobiota bacterium]